MISHSNSTYFELNERIIKRTSEVTINTLNQKGSDYMTEKLDEFIKDNTKELFIIRFEKNKDLIHFKYIKQFLYNYEVSNNNKKTKMVLMLIHKPMTKDSLKEKKLLDSGITFGYPQPDWEYNIIENLSGSNYK